jgi:hypothetical protein
MAALIHGVSRVLRANQQLRFTTAFGGTISDSWATGWAESDLESCGDCSPQIECCAKQPVRSVIRIWRGCAVQPDHRALQPRQMGQRVLGAGSIERRQSAVQGLHLLAEVSWQGEANTV